MWPIDDLHDVLDSDVVALGVRGDSEMVVLLLCQRCRFQTPLFSIHVQNLEVLLLQSDDDTYGLRVYVHHIPERKPAQGIYTRGHICTQLDVFG